MLAALREHFNGPVMPVSRYCDALRTWSECMIKRHEYDSEAANALMYVELQIRKSDLLARLIYGGEALRTKKCPVHDGRWSGITPCEHGCGSTGWVPDDWPDGANRCTVHPDRPAVSASVHITEGRREMCWACYRERWG